MFAVRSQEMNKMITMGGQYIYELWSANRKHDTRGMTFIRGRVLRLLSTVEA